VTDGGIGMDQQTISRLCEPFVQGDTRTTRRYGGTGLGLAICRRLADLMGGRLQIESALGEGSTVSILLPLTAVEPAAARKKLETSPGIASPGSRAPSIEAAAATGQLVLLVDDHPTNRRLLVRQLAWLGYAAEAAADGVEALGRFVARRAAGMSYALVITDCQMPEMDGYELTQRIRALEKGAADRTVILAFTANTLREAIDECHAAGMDDVLTKPIELAALKARLEQWLPLRELPPEALAQIARQSIADSRPAADTSITGEFCVAHDEDMVMLHRAIRERRPNAVATAAHRIKGAARMYGDNALAEAAETLEQCARASESWEPIEAATRRVAAATQRLFTSRGWLSQSRSA
jgi:CheY-like chemotaxis protein